MNHEIESMTVAEIGEQIEASEAHEERIEGELDAQRQHTYELREYLATRMALAEPDGVICEATRVGDGYGLVGLCTCSRHPNEHPRASRRTVK